MGGSTRLRDQSPGASSVGSHASGEEVPRRRGAPVSVGSTSVRRGALSWTPGSKSRNPRPADDRNVAVQCARDVVDFLGAHGFGRPMSYEKFLKDPSTKEFFDIFKFLVAQLDPQLAIEGRIEDEVPAIMRRLRYPEKVNKSWLQAISGPNTWHRLLAVLEWLCLLVQYNNELVHPVALCQLDPPEASDPRDEVEHQLLPRLHDNYQQFLGGKDDHSCEEQLRQIYVDRIEAMRSEIARLRQEQATTEQRLRDLRSKHEYLVELQLAPKQLEMEAERLRNVIKANEESTWRVREETAVLQEECIQRGEEVHVLQENVRKLSEQVESQAYSKRDIERLKVERKHLRSILDSLRADCDKTEEDVWKCDIEGSRLEEEIGRAARRVNEAVENAEDPAIRGTSLKDLMVRVDLNEPMDVLASLDFSEERSLVQAHTAAQEEAAKEEEATLLHIAEEQRVAQEELSEKERTCFHLKARLEQRQSVRDQHRVWSVTQLDEAQRTVEETEDAVQMVSRSTAPSMRDDAEVDDLRIQLSSMEANFAEEQLQLSADIARDRERFLDYQQRVIATLNGLHESMEDLEKDCRIVIKGSSLLANCTKAARGGS